MIPRTELKTYVDDALKGLKDFQSASVDALFDGLYREDRPCMLLADEVGLGKTVVARGLIARKLLEQLSTPGRRRTFRVTYICSNQVIARENLQKLNLFPANIAMKEPVSRIAYLAYEPEERPAKNHQNLLELNTLTPATSFEISRGIGDRWERQAIYAVLHRDTRMRNRHKGLEWILKGSVRKMKRFRRELRWAAENREVRSELPKKYVALLKRTLVAPDAEAIYAEFPRRRRLTLYDATIAIAEQIDGRSWGRLSSACWHLVRQLRECLVKCCLPYVNADLYILDEFQRFRDLIDEDSEEEQAKIARQIFFHRRKNTRVLLLSATPFKAFTGSHEADQGDDHYRDFRRVLRFLLRDDQEQLARYEKHRKSLYRQILDLRTEGTNALNRDHRDEVEKILRSVICRTERHSVISDANALIEDVWKRPDAELPFGPGDILNFQVTDKLARALTRAGLPAAKPVEYCKSALHPLSFLDLYKLKELLKQHRDHPEVLAALQDSKPGWLDLRAIDKYRWTLETAASGDSGPTNARLRMLVDQAVGSHGAGLLWLPPSLPYYGLEAAFDGATGFTKTLLFSSWIMVPRMLATLVSYEVEKRTIGDPRTLHEEQEKEPRRYFTPKSKKRHPLPQMPWSRRSSDGLQLANMSNFTLLYPSLSLADAIDPVANLEEGLTLAEILDRATRRIEALIKDAGLDRYQRRSVGGERWYRAAPLLLDRHLSTGREVIRRFFEDEEAWDQGSWSQEEDGDEPGAKEEHFQYLGECFDDPSLINLGPPPPDLARTLALLALGTPGITCLRSLRRLFPVENDAPQMARAFGVAEEFLSLYNKPESIAAVRLYTPDGPFWQRAAHYGANGCLQAVLDEYFHQLKGQNVGVTSAAKQLRSAVNLNASTINVDSLETFLAGKPKGMRCHYAVEFGSQKIESNEGRQRASNLREVFNSPFRPFLLATTSIGQEGLDFHSYCRRIVHWNLPGNPVDLEQREGRINRFKSLVIRQQVASRYRSELATQGVAEHDDVWDKLFAIADREERIKASKCELIPYWHVEADGGPKIERIIPMYPFSVDRGRLTHILRTLAIYRLAFGQPRQTELVDHLLECELSPDQIRQVIDTLMIDLSPIRYSSR